MGDHGSSMIEEVNAGSDRKVAENSALKLHGYRMYSEPILNDYFKVSQLMTGDKFFFFSFECHSVKGEAVLLTAYSKETLGREAKTRNIFSTLSLCCCNQYLWVHRANISK